MRVIIEALKINTTLTVLKLHRVFFMEKKPICSIAESDNKRAGNEISEEGRTILEEAIKLNSPHIDVNSVSLWII